MEAALGAGGGEEQSYPQLPNVFFLFVNLNAGSRVSTVQCEQRVRDAVLLGNQSAAGAELLEAETVPAGAADFLQRAAVFRAELRADAAAERRQALPACTPPEYLYRKA